MGDMPSASLGLIRGYLSGNSAAVTQNDFTQVLFNTIDVDTDSAWDSVNKRYVPKRAGWWLIGASITWATPADQERLIVAIYKNGVEKARLADEGASQASTHAKIRNGVGPLNFNGSTDYFDIRGFTSGAGRVYAGDAGGSWVTFFAHFLG